MNAVTIEVLDSPSHSKGWGRFRLTDPATDRAIQTARTGNEWMSANMREVQAEGPILLTIQVMLRVGSGVRARQEISKVEIPLFAAPGEILEVQHKPGSQGMKLRVNGACKAAVYTVSRGGS